MPLRPAELGHLVRQYADAGHLGPADQEIAWYSAIHALNGVWTFVVSLTELDAEGYASTQHLHLVQIDEETGTVQSTERLELRPVDVATILRDTHLGPLRKYEEVPGGSLFSLRRRAWTRMFPEQSYMLRLRFSGRVKSTLALTTILYRRQDPALPVPQPIPAPGGFRPGVELHITTFVPGCTGSELWPRLNIDGKIAVVKQVARAYDAIWSTNIPRPAHLIGQAHFYLSPTATGTVGVDSREDLGGPWRSVRAFLRAFLRWRLRGLRDQNGIDEYKDTYLEPIAHGVDTVLATLSPTLDDLPVVLNHADLGLHRLVFSDEAAPRLRAVLGWERVDYAPFPVNVPRLVGSLFTPDQAPVAVETWTSAADAVPEGSDGSDGSDDMGRLAAAFWDEVPRWGAWMGTAAARTFVDCYEFGEALRPEGVVPQGSSAAEDRRERWRWNVEVVESFLHRYIGFDGENTGQ